MPKFIPLSTFSKYYNKHSDLLTDEGIIKFRKSIELKGERIALEAGFQRADYEEFGASLKKPSTIIFQGWIEQNKGLLGLLTKGELITFIDTGKHLEHQISSTYQRYVSPYLSEILLRFSNSKKELLAQAFSYVQLLDSDHRSVVEDQLFKGLSDNLKDLKALNREVSNEQELVNITKPLCSDEVIACVNYLSKASYDKKLSYVDEILAVIKTKACTTRFANWILKRMEEVTLNREHEYKIVDLRKDLALGNIRVRNRAKGRTPIRWKTIGTVLFIGGMSAFLYYIIIYKPFSDVNDPQFTNNTSFKQFSLEERKRIDSLLQEMNKKRKPEEISIDYVDPGSTGTSIALRRAFTNETMEGVYEDLSKDADLKTNYPQTPCGTGGNVYKRNPGIIALSKKTGNYDAMMKNESDYDIIFYVSENTKDGEVHSMMIKKGETRTFKMKKGDVFTMVAGNNFKPFIEPVNAVIEEIPSSNFERHFCDTDQNYRESINLSYSVSYPKTGKNKFMVMGAKNGYVNLIDVHQVLEEF
ncbi:MAG: hypothetical protein MK066_02195 [Crocinitomicaceae bacterium]|nr:hypothetical protein [Crocinitomicaceae bacterium]